MSSFDQEQHIDEVMRGDTEAAEDYDRWLWEQERKNIQARREADEVSRDDLEDAADFYDNLCKQRPGG